jgi:UDP-GlcNAc:undecaprenyl-phosphate/decaprenyl-phosphate GlcNAc-1-phosphate transferase
MPGDLYYITAFVVSLVVVLISTPIVNHIGHLTGYVDQPGERKIHNRPMVRLGGVAIFLGFIVAVSLVWSLGAFGTPAPEKKMEILGLLIGALLFFFIGLADDLFSLSPSVRLFLQIVVASLAWYWGVKIDFISLPFIGIIDLGWFGAPLTIVWLVGMANAINWIDGVDGLAAGVSGISAVVMLIVTLFVGREGGAGAALIAASLAGAALGFLRYNFNPAQIFMGDGGSYFMGFTLAGLGTIGLVKSLAVTAILLPYLILAVPIVDMTFVILSRISQGRSPFLADKRHLHHRLLNAGISQKSTVLFIYALTFWVGSLALGFSNVPSGWGFAVASTIILLYVGWQIWRERSLNQG